MNFYKYTHMLVKQKITIAKATSAYEWKKRGLNINAILNVINIPFWIFI